MSATDIRAIVEALNAGRVAAALDACRVELATAPDDPALNQLAGTAALRLERFEEAADFARRSLAARPDHAATLILAGRALLARADHPAAVAALDHAVVTAPRNAEAAFLLAAAQLQAGAVLEPVTLDRLLELFPREAAGWERVAESAQTRGHRETALFCLTAAERTAPSFPLTMRVGLIAKELGQPAEARLAFARAVKSKPGEARAWFLLGVASQDLRENAAAEEAYCRALALDPTLAEAAVNLGTLLQEQGDLDGAKAAYAEAVTARPDTFSRVAQALTTSPRGELWLDLRRLRRALAG